MINLIEQMRTLLESELPDGIKEEISSVFEIVDYTTIGSEITDTTETRRLSYFETVYSEDAYNLTDLTTDETRFVENICYRSSYHIRADIDAGNNSIKVLRIYRNLIPTNNV
jgi:hypothetical protein